MSKQILDAGGKAVARSSSQLRRQQVPSPDKNLRPEEISKLDFQPLGNWLLAEAVFPEIKTEGGIDISYRPSDKPFFRVLRMGSTEYQGEFQNNVHLGDVIYSPSISALRVFHTYPKVTLDPGDPEKKIPTTVEERMLVMMAYGSFDGIIPGYRWEEKESAKAIRKVGTPMVDFQTEFTQAIMNDMATPEEAALIEFIPLSEKIVIERVPPKAKQGSFYMPDVQDQLPFFRILKMPHDPSILSPHLQKLRVGDVVQMNGITPMMSYPTGLKNTEGKDRDCYVASAGLITGYYPSLHWDHKPKSVEISDTVTAKEN